MVVKVEASVMQVFHYTCAMTFQVTAHVVLFQV